MIDGILFAILAGVMLGLYALPAKFVKGYEYENTWGMFFAIALLAVPAIAAILLVNGFCDIVMALDTKVLLGMVITSFLWGWGVQLWSKAINYIGVSLGFSIFIGTVILIGSLLPFIIDGLPNTKALSFIGLGLLAVLFGIFCNARAGLLRQNSSGDENKLNHMGIGIFIAVFGGVLATGFSFANALGAKEIATLSEAQNNASWVASIIVMIIIYVSGAIFAMPYFAYQLFKNKTWGKFSGSFCLNSTAISIMAIFNFSASAVFAYAASQLGSAGNTVGYAIFNTVSVLTAVLGGIIAKEWLGSSKNAKACLFFALMLMVLGVAFIAYGNSLVACCN